MKKTKAFPQIKYPEIQCGVYGGNVHSDILGKQKSDGFSEAGSYVLCSDEAYKGTDRYR